MERMQGHLLEVGSGGLPITVGYCTLSQKHFLSLQATNSILAV